MSNNDRTLGHCTTMYYKLLKLPLLDIPVHVGLRWTLVRAFERGCVRPDQGREEQRDGRQLIAEDSGHLGHLLPALLAVQGGAELTHQRRVGRIRPAHLGAAP